MSAACREHELDALLAGELSLADAERVRAHAEGCAACTHALAWLRLERGWMAQRARREPARPALRFSALEARLAEATRASRPTPFRGTWAHQWKMALGAVAAVVFVAFSMAQVPPAASEEPWSRDAWSIMTNGEACEDTTGEAMAALEARVGACLVASPMALTTSLASYR